MGLLSAAARVGALPGGREVRYRRLVAESDERRGDTAPSGTGEPIALTPTLAMMDKVDLSTVDWSEVADQLVCRGWTRLARAVAPPTLGVLEQAASEPWFSLPETEAGVRQAGLACHRAVEESADVVRSLADAICAGIDGAHAPDAAGLPAFNHAEWCRAEMGQKFITPHRDPDTAGGVIAVLTIGGRAVFRVWDLDASLADAQSHPELATAWETEAGDLVLMVSGGWPLPTSRCPIHEAESPLAGDRLTLTLRHNKGGYGADYFS